MKSKKHFTLLEVIISLFLISIILSVLFGFFSKITKIEKNIEDLKNKVYERNEVYLTLNNILTSLCFNEDNSIYTMYEKNNKYLSLFFTYDAGVDPSPYFSNIISGKIFIDEKNNLVLETYPNDKKIEPREETIFKNIKSIEYKFLSKNLSDQTHVLEKVTNSIFWYSAWPKDKKVVPAIVYIKINGSVEFVFFLQPHLI